MADLHPVWRAYRAVAPALGAVLPAVAPFSAKLRAGLEGRRGLATRIRREAARLRGCVWVHVTSVGEYEQARPVIVGLRDRLGSAAPPVAVTHFSPSGFEFARRRPCADHHEYVPFDHPAAMASVVEAWRPRLVVFVKFDIWPNLVLEATGAGVPTVLLAGTLQPRSLRLLPVARSMFRDLFDRFSHLGVCSEGDRRRFRERLGVSAPVTVTGDTRAEQVILRYEEAGEGAVAARLRALGGRLLILGSTWPPDERLWLPVLPALLAEHADLRVVLAPHEPRPDRLAALEESLQSRAVATTRLSHLLERDGGAEPARCILVDSVGVLAEIYRAGSLAYVGGSFTTGVHNTMEPAVASLPVLFGPRIQNAREAGELVERGAGFVLRRSEEARAVAAALLGDPDDLARRGAAGRAVVLAQRGATEKSLAVVRPYL